MIDNRVSYMQDLVNSSGIVWYGFDPEVVRHSGFKSKR